MGKYDIAESKLLKVEAVEDPVLWDNSDGRVYRVTLKVAGKGQDIEKVFYGEPEADFFVKHARKAVERLQKAEEIKKEKEARKW